MEDKDKGRWRGPTEAIESRQLIQRVDIEDLLQIESPCEWEVNLRLSDEGIYRRKFNEQDLRLMTRQERRSLLGDRQGLLLKLPCSRTELGDFIRREGLRGRIDRDFLRKMNSDWHRIKRSAEGPTVLRAPKCETGRRSETSDLTRTELLRELGKKGAVARHASTRDAKALVLQWWNENVKGTMSKEAAADAIVAAKLVSETRQTIRKWLTEPRNGS